MIEKHVKEADDVNGRYKLRIEIQQDKHIEASRIIAYFFFHFKDKIFSDQTFKLYNTSTTIIISTNNQSLFGECINWLSVNLEKVAKVIVY